MLYHTNLRTRLNLGKISLFKNNTKNMQVMQQTIREYKDYGSYNRVNHLVVKHVTRINGCKAQCGQGLLTGSINSITFVSYIRADDAAMHQVKLCNMLPSITEC